MGVPERPNAGHGDLRDPVYSDIISYLERRGENQPVKVRQISAFVRAKTAMRMGVPLTGVDLFDIHEELTERYLRRLDELGLVDHSPPRGIVFLNSAPDRVQIN